MSSTDVPGPDAPSEPLITVGSITSAVTAVIALVVSFGLHVTNDQQSAVLGVIAVVAPFLVALVGRGKVFSPASVRKLLRARGGDA
jgi:hypothetical protein